MKKCKIRSTGVMWASRDLLLKFWDPPNISGTVNAGNFKFGTEMDGSEYSRKKCKIRSKGVRWGHVTHFCSVGTSPSPKRLRLGT